MPSHSHSFTPSGTVGSHTHSFTPSGTVGNHTHTGPSHSHSFTPSGTVSSSFDGTAGTTSSNGAHTHTYMIASSRNRRSSGTGNEIWEYEEYVNTSSNGDHTHTYTPSGTVSSSFSGTDGTTSAAGTGNTGATQPSFYGTAGYTGETQPSFTGTAGYTDANGSGSSFSILPPYVVKYCWERTA